MPRIGALFAALVVLSIWLPSVHAEEQGEARAILGRAIKALGGEAKLTKWQAATWKGHGLYFGFDPEGIPYTGDWAIQGTGQNRVTALMDLNKKGKLSLITVLNGDRGWRRVGDRTVDMDDKLLAENLEQLYTDWIVPLTLPLDDRAQLSQLRDISIHEHPAQGVTLKYGDHRPVHLYFDKSTGLLSKSETRIKDVHGYIFVKQETFYTNYKEIEGVPRAMRIEVFRDGQRHLTADLSDYKTHKKLDDSVFAKP